MKTQLRTSTATVVSRGRSTFRTLVPAVLLALSPQSVAGTDLADVYRDIQAGQQLTAEDVANLEDVLLADPYATEARVRLIGYHWQRIWGNDDSRRRHSDLTLWMVRNSPRHALFEMAYGRIDRQTSPESFQQTREAWLAHLEAQPEDPVLLGNAADFLLMEDRPLAMSLLHTAQAVDPANADWPGKIGHLTRLGSTTQAAAAEALPHFERAYTLSDNPYARERHLVSVVRTAYEAGRFDLARTYASEALPVPDPERMGDLHHHAHTVLGRLALREGDVGRAGDHLLASADTVGSPVLSSFGPNMRLAGELLDHGEDDVVLRYLDACGEFWSDTRGRLQRWTAEIREGGKPDFDGRWR
ncbi:MAG: hypothetical protein OXI55_04145 [Gammaproteobacteria bacterium]|nr:hypothetical protein [Gammaproteobacteria bacterium]